MVRKDFLGWEDPLDVDPRRNEKKRKGEWKRERKIKRK